MSKLSVEEIVARYEQSPVRLLTIEEIADLIASWRERGEALRPFADAANDWPTPAEWEAECKADGHIISFPAEDKDSLDDWKHTLTVGDCRHASAALTEPKDKNAELVAALLEQADKLIDRWAGDPMVADDELATAMRLIRASWRERGEALRLSRPFVNVAASPRQAEASTRWHDKAITALAAIDAALGPEPKAVSDPREKARAPDLRALISSWRERGEALKELLAELEGPINSRTSPRIERARAALGPETKEGDLGK